MLKNLISVSGFTLLSRLTGFARDVAMGAVIGAGPVMDAFATAFRIPNHFRAIFAEGAFAAAFVPAYTKLKTQGEHARAHALLGQMLTILIVSAGLVVLAGLFLTEQVLALLAPGFQRTPDRQALALELTRITFPYLLMIAIVTLWSDALNAVRRFAVPAFAPVILNLCLIAAMLAAVAFKTPGHAAAWGVFAAGIIEVLLLTYAARRAGVFAPPMRPRRGGDVSGFFKTFFPAVIGSAGAQIAMFADTIIATLLPAGAVSAVYYADRLYQLPIGVIAIAAGTVLLPEMSRRIAAEDAAGAHRSQNQVIGLTLALTLPFTVAFLLLPLEIITAVFQRGAFDAKAAEASAAVLAAYGAGLPAVVLIRSVVASFQSRGDTRTPMLISLFAVAVNVALKLVLTGPFGAAGLALATSAGVWLNLGVLAAVALRRGWLAPSPQLLRIIASVIAAGAVLALAALYLRGPVFSLAAGLPYLRAEGGLALIGIAGAAAYGAALLASLRLVGVRLPGRAGGKPAE